MEVLRGVSVKGPYPPLNPGCGQGERTHQMDARGDPTVQTACTLLPIGGLEVSSSADFLMPSELDSRNCYRETYRARSSEGAVSNQRSLSGMLSTHKTIGSRRMQTLVEERGLLHVKMRESGG